MINQREPDFFIGMSTSLELRKRASSGGVGTAVMKFLLNEKKFGTSISFSFNEKLCMYEPRMVYSADDIVVCGSVYQDIDLCRFVKDNLSSIRGGIVLSCTPCMVNSIKSILKREDIPCFVISFCCSGQTNIEGTWKYYQLIGEKKENILNMQYRGNGWPSGIQILKKDGSSSFFPNYSEPWATIHQSNLFRPRRCFLCKRDCSYDSDLSLADPWRHSCMENDNIGKTMFFTNTPLGKEIMDLVQGRMIIESFPISRDDYIRAQKPNVEKEKRIIRDRKKIDWHLKLVKNSRYYSFVIKSCFTMKLHMLLLKLLRFF